MKYLLFLLGILIVVSCNNNDDEISIFQPTILEFITLKQGNLSNYEGLPQLNLVISNESEWNELLAQIDSVDNNDVTADLYPMDIDFNNNDIIAVILEVKTSLWYVEITEILENEDEVKVSISEIQTVLDAISQPFHIVEISKTNKPVVFN